MGVCGSALVGKRYPWGDEIDDTKANYGNNIGNTTVVGSYPTNGYGLYDMAGNIYEWCQDWYDENYYNSSPEINPQGPETGTTRVLGSGSWITSLNSLRLSYRNDSNPNTRVSHSGFRCVSGFNMPSDSFTTLLPSDNQTGFNWFADLGLNASDYTWVTVNSSSATLSVRLFVQPLGGVDASSWDFSAVTTIDGLVDQLGSDGLNLVEGTDYQLLVVGQDDNGTVDDASDDLVETLDTLLSDLVPEPEVIENPPNQIVWNQDGAEMALIPAGSFEMDDHLDNMSDALPVHTVTLDGFYIDKTEVTVGQFKAFLADSGYNWAGSWDEVDQYSPSGDHPMIEVNYDDAVAYCEWAGKRLPTEAEWEYAARGGLEGQRYPWGNDAPDGSKANYWGDGDDSGTTVAGSYSVNGHGLYDVAGNVYEWCADWYGNDYYTYSLDTNPQGPATGTYRVLRGGSWLNFTSPTTSVYELPLAFRTYSDRMLGSSPTDFGVCPVSILLLILLSLYPRQMVNLLVILYWEQLSSISCPAST